MPRRSKRRIRAGHNRRKGSQRSGGWGRRVFLLLVLGALGYAFFAFPIRGKTAWQHATQLVSSEVVKAEAKLKGVPELQKPETKPKAAANGKGDKGKGGSFDKAQDKLTGKDQKALEDLINEKMKKP
ncbi:MAG: hypothetical protein HY897_05915 [Deltaproteobacteria bacterium]|nr:hypothetical protein [Deltaproteobacteria bacterium]